MKLCSLFSNCCFSKCRRTAVTFIVWEGYTIHLRCQEHFDYQVQDEEIARQIVAIGQIEAISSYLLLNRLR